MQRSAVPSYFSITHLSSAAPSGQSVPGNMLENAIGLLSDLDDAVFPYHLEYFPNIYK